MDLLNGAEMNGLSSKGLKTLRRMICKEFRDCWRLQLQKGDVAAVPEFEIELEVDAKQPKRPHSRKYSLEQLTFMRQELKRLLEAGVIRPSKSNWLSATHMVPKKEKGEWRTTGDFREMNKKTIPILFQLPRIEDILHALKGQNFFRSLIY